MTHPLATWLAATSTSTATYNHGHYIYGVTLILLAGALALAIVCTMDVCRYCGSCPENATWFPFAMPIGTARERFAPCTPNAEVGRSHARLPVTHTDPGDAELGGRWYYYSKGCSDLFLDVGRTLKSLNRVHAAVLLEQRLAGVGRATAAADASHDADQHSMQSLLLMPPADARKLLRAKMDRLNQQHQQKESQPLQVWPSPSSSSDQSYDAAIRRVARAMSATVGEGMCSGPLWEFDVLKRARDPRRGVGSYANLPGSPETMANLVGRAPIDTNIFQLTCACVCSVLLTSLLPLTHTCAPMRHVSFCM